MDRALVGLLQRTLGPHLAAPPSQRHDQTEIRIAPGDVTEVMRTLHDHADLRFEYLSDLCGVDTGEEFQVVYHLWSDVTSDWLRVIAQGIPRDQARVPSITFLWKGAEWMEREAYDMFGIAFEGNRDLRRLYLPEDFVGHPLRKDFHLPDDASRSPGAGIRPMERTEDPRDAVLATSRRGAEGRGVERGGAEPGAEPPR